MRKTAFVSAYLKGKGGTIGTDCPKLFAQTLFSFGWVSFGVDLPFIRKKKKTETTVRKNDETTGIRGADHGFPPGVRPRNGPKDKD